jgi:hypothetical protein
MNRLIAVLVVGGISAFAAPTLRAEVEWRRTARGWEKMEHWSSPNSHSAIESPAANRSRWDTHPAGLALVQTVGVLLAMIAFPRPNQSVPSKWLQEDWRTVLRRSFRASLFGS